MHKAIRAIDRQTTTQCNKLLHFKDSMVMYGIYNVEIQENCIHTEHHMHNSTTEIERLFPGQISKVYIHDALIH